MVTAKKILEIAEKEIGEPIGINKYNEEYGIDQNADYCCVFIWWVFKQAKASELFYGNSKTAYCPYLRNYHIRAGQQIIKDYQPGDIIFFDFDNNRLPNHVGICISYDGTKITTIDGNTGTNGKVAVAVRSNGSILDGYRPAYTTSEPGSDVNSKIEQSTLTITASNPWQNLIRSNGLMLKKKQFINMATAINNFYIAYKGAENTLKGQPPSDGAEFIAMHNEGTIVNKPSAEIDLNLNNVGDFITASAFNKLLNGVYENTNAPKEKMQACLQKYTPSYSNITDITTIDIKVIADDTIIAAELFDQLGTDVGNLKTIFTAEWKVPEDDSQ